MKTRLLFLASLILSASLVDAQTTTAFTYQGQLNSGNAAATGLYDFQFTLFDSSSNLIAGPITNAATAVSNGLFSAQVDFGAGAFSGPPRWLALGVRTNGSTNDFTNLTPSQMITAAPYSITAINLAGPLATTNLSGSLSLSQLPSTVVTNGAGDLTLNGSFNGNGSGLTNLSVNLPAGLVTNAQVGVTLGGTFTGNGAGLTGVNASTFSGAVGLGQLPASVVVDGDTFVDLSGTFSGFFNGNGSGLNSLNAGTLTGSIPAGALSGVDGSGLVSLNGSQITSGTIPLSVLPTLPGASLNPTFNSVIVTNAALFSNTVVIVTNNGGQSVVFSNGNVLASGSITNLGNLNVGGTITGSGAGLTGLLSAGGHPVVDTTVTNVLSVAVSSADTTITNFILASSNNVMLIDSNTVYAASNVLNAALMSAGTTISNIFQSGSPTLSNLALNATLPIIQGPTTNAGGLWVTNGTLFVTNISTGAIVAIRSSSVTTTNGPATGVGVVLSNGNVIASGNVIAIGSFIGDGSFLTSLDATQLTSGAVPSGALTSVPAGNLTGTIPQGAIPGTYIDAVTFDNLNNSFTGDSVTIGAGGISTSGTLSATGITDNGSTTSVKTLNADAVTALQFVGKGNTPTIVVGSDATVVGSGASASIVGTASSGQITINTGGGTGGTGVLVKVSFPIPFPNATYPIIFPADGNTATTIDLWVAGDTSPTYLPSSTGFTINVVGDEGAIADYSIYHFNYVVIGR